ncbi:ATP-binding protein [Corynebacterium bovis]|uniref:ATP-binding protein n=1 Tax=Corynebacterium bovis TaxID=36808 RepID=UPI0031397CC0
MSPDGERFLDNVRCEGSASVMVEDALAVLRRNMNKAAVIDGHGRADRYDYPLEVLRELLVNAVMHRDYSPGAQGSQVTVELYADRIVVQNPGGLYGPVTVESLGGVLPVSSSRNALLSKFFEDAPDPVTGKVLAENRGSGIPTVLRALHDADMTPPDFRSTLVSMEVSVPHHALLTPDTLTWISGLPGAPFSRSQTQAPAVLRSGRRVNSSLLQGWGLDPIEATRTLSELVKLGIIRKINDRRWAQYTLAVPTSGTTPAEQILAAFEGRDELTRRQIEEATGIPRPTVNRHLAALITDGRLVGVNEPYSPHRAYRLP